MISMQAMTKEEEFEVVIRNLPYVQKLLRSTKIDIKEKLSVLEDVNIDLIVYLQSIGQEV